MIVDRYRAAGLRGNPFAAEGFAGDIVELFVDRGLPEPPAPGSSTLVQVIGEKGAGKSTHVLRWRGLVDGPYHYVPRRPVSQRWGRPPVAALVYADEIDRMPGPVRHRWFRASARIGATIVAGTHRDLSAAARRAGLQVLTHHLLPADAVTLRCVIERRLDHARVARTPAGLLDDHDIAEVHRLCGGNIRMAESLLHDMVAERVHAIEPRHSTR